MRRILIRVANFLFDRKPRRSNFIRNISKFVVNECVVGDYYEFGVYRGETTAQFFHMLTQTATRRLENTNPISESATYQARAWFQDSCNFNLYDSFEGLPSLTSSDKGTNDFFEGQYSVSERDVIRKLTDSKVPIERVNTVAGWFSTTCDPMKVETSSLRKASVIWLDCDLYSSASDALKIFSTILQPGTIVVIDDWHCFKGDPKRGVQAAWNEFCDRKEIKETFYFVEYLSDSWARKSFICVGVEK